MSHARDLLTLLLASAPPSTLSLLTSGEAPAPEPAAASPKLTATIVSKPAPIASVDAFNAQLTIGGKDEALRQAASLFKVAGENMERGRMTGESYWVDALKIRKGNWGLIPAPLPFNSQANKLADKTSKDFLVSFGLEECVSLEFARHTY